MARRSRKNRDTRDTRSIANQRLRFGSSVLDRQLLNSLRSISDRRLWHPEGKYAPYGNVGGPRSRIVARGARNENVSSRRASSSFKKPNLWSAVPVGIGFESPS